MIFWINWHLINRSTISWVWVSVIANTNGVSHRICSVVSIYHRVEYRVEIQESFTLNMEPRIFSIVGAVRWFYSVGTVVPLAARGLACLWLKAFSLSRLHFSYALCRCHAIHRILHTHTHKYNSPIYILHVYTVCSVLYVVYCIRDTLFSKIIKMRSSS